MFSKSIREFIKNPIITVPNIIFSLLSQVILSLLITNNTLLNSDITNSIGVPNVDPQEIAMFLATFLLIILMYIFVSPIALSWTYQLCKKVVKGETYNFFQELRTSLKHYWRMLGTTVVMGLILFAVYLVFVFIIVLTIMPIAISQNSESALGAGIFAGIFALLLLLVFIVVVVFLAICLSPTQPLVVYDNLNIGQSISKGFKFGLKKFFPILGAFLATLAIGLISYLFLNLLFGSDSLIFTVIYTLISSYVGLFPIIYIMNLYENEKQKKEAGFTLNQYPIYAPQPQEDIHNTNREPVEKPEEDNKPDEPENNFKI